MNAQFKRTFKRVVVAHVTMIVLITVYPMIKDLFHRPEPVKELTFIDLSQMSIPALPTVQEVPEPEIASEPEAPEPEPDIPEPVKVPEKKVEPKKEPEKPKEKPKIKISTNKVKRAVSPKVKDKPPLTPEEIRKMMAAGLPAGSSSPSGGSPSAMSWYYALVRATMYEAWEQPSGLSGTGLRATVSIRVQKDGNITKRTMIRPSGNSVIDQSVMRAVNGVSRIKALPPEAGSSLDITIDFELTGAVF